MRVNLRPFLGRFGLTLAGAEQILPAGPQQAGESRHAGWDLLLQHRTYPAADLQQVICSDVSVELHLNTRQRQEIDSCADDASEQKEL